VQTKIIDLPIGATKLYEIMEPLWLNKVGLFMAQQSTGNSQFGPNLAAKSCFRYHVQKGRRELVIRLEFVGYNRIFLPVSDDSFENSSFRKKP